MEQKLKCDVYIGKNLRRLREKFGLSQEKLCAELQCRNCDIGRSTYAKYENGELNIRISVLMELKKMTSCCQHTICSIGLHIHFHLMNQNLIRGTAILKANHFAISLEILLKLFSVLSVMCRW